MFFMHCVYIGNIVDNEGIMLVESMEPGPGVVKVFHPFFSELDADTSDVEESILDYFSGLSVIGDSSIAELKLVRDQSTHDVTAVFIKFSDPSCKHSFYSNCSTSLHLAIFIFCRFTRKF